MNRIKTLVSLMAIGAFVLLLYGCTVRTYTVEKPRVDTEITGNQGCISGSCTPEKRESNLSSTRKTTVIEVELKSKADQEMMAEEKAEAAEEAPAKEPAALFEEPAPEEQVNLEEPESKVYKEVEERYDAEREAMPAPQPEPMQPAAAKPHYTIYTVQKNDTLQKISYTFYNTTRRWNKIFEANRDILKSPDSIYPGQVLKIPPK